jgi:hypothetical protein
MRKLLGVVAMALVTALVAWPTIGGRVSAQAPSSGGGGVSLEVINSVEPKPSGSRQFPVVHTVRFACGTVAASAGDPRLPADPEALAVPGTYLTEISVFNRSVPGTAGPAATLHLHAVAADELGAEFGPVRGIEGEVVPAHRAVTIDCDDIYRLLGVTGSPGGPLVTGYLSIYSNAEVDVSVVYTTKS